jgi:hypothetical protein
MNTDRNFISQLHIENTVEIAELQRLFRQQFINLNLWFFWPQKDIEKVFTRDNLVSYGKIKASELSLTYTPGMISIDGRVKTGELEKMLLEKFGLYAQVMRRSGASWLETSHSDELTLWEQNTKAEESLAAKVPQEGPDFDAYHEQL